jgi:hypothetical protein
MKVRIQKLWRVPVFCAAASWICFYITVYLGGLFFVVQTAGADGAIQFSVDPVRSVIFDVVLFLIVLLVGGLWVLRSMTKKEIAISAGLTSVMYLLIVLAQIYIPDIPLSFSVALARIQNWTGTVTQFLLKLTDHFNFSVIASSFAPLLFIPFGKNQIQNANALSGQENPDG